MSRINRRSLAGLYRCFQACDAPFAEQLLDGSVYFNTVAHYHGIEDGRVRGDKYEGCAVLHVPTGLPLNVNGQPRDGHHYDVFRSAARAGEIWIACYADRLTTEHLRKFGPVVVAIEDPAELARRVTANLPTDVRVDGVPGSERLVYRVKYFTNTAQLITRWGIPGQIAYSKLKPYEWQSEVRLIFGTSDALEVENVEVFLERLDGKMPPVRALPLRNDGTVRPKAPPSAYANKPRIIDVPGGIRDIARLLTGDEAERIARRSAHWLALNRSLIE